MKPARLEDKFSMVWTPIQGSLRARSDWRDIWPGPTTQPLLGILATPENSLEFLLENDPELVILAREAKRSAHRTIRNLDDTIAHVNRTLMPIGKHK